MSLSRAAFLYHRSESRQFTYVSEDIDRRNEAVTRTVFNARSFV